MRNSTLLAISAMFLCSTASMAQKAPVKNALADLAKVIKGQKTVAMHKAAAPLKDLRKEMASDWKAKNQETYQYNSNDKSWDFYCESSYSYNFHGDVTEVVTTVGTAKQRTTYKYNSRYQMTEELTQVAADGVNYVNDTRHVCQYDDADPTLVYLSEYSQWNATNGAWEITSTESEPSEKTEVERDAAGRVTFAKEYTYDGTVYALSGGAKMTWKKDGSLDTFTMYEIDDAGSLEETFILSDFVWEKTNNIIPVNEDYWFEGDNMLKSAKVSMDMYGTSYSLGTFGAEYGEKGSYTAVMDLNLMGMMTMSTTLEYKVLDDNGSNSLEQIIKQNGQLAYDIKQVTMIDENNCPTLYEIYADQGSGLALYSGQKMEHKYEGGRNYPVESLQYITDDNAEYQLAYKYVTTEFFDLATTVNRVKADTEAAGTVYNVKGVKMGTDINRLPAGLYIVKTAGKTVKVVKR